MDKTVEELEAYRVRLEQDIRRSRNIDPHGLSHNSPLVKNHEQVLRDIASKQNG
jgi:hypothetical protein